MSELTKQVMYLVGVLLVIALVLALFGGWPTSRSASTTGTNPEPAPVAPTAEQLQKLKESPAFQYLVSYTDTGFQPTTVSVRSGQNVRFMNNSSHDLWVAAVRSATGQVYPGTSNCGGSSFDSCTPIKHGDYWEFTFQQTGTWDFQNNLDKSQTGSVIVQ